MIYVHTAITTVEHHKQSTYYHLTLQQAVFYKYMTPLKGHMHLETVSTNLYSSFP